MFVQQLHAATPFVRAMPRAAAPAPRPALPIETDQVELLVAESEGDERVVRAYLAVVDGRAYLRPCGGSRCAWVRASESGRSVAVTWGDDRVDVELRPVLDAEIQRRVSEELLGRFGYDRAMRGLLAVASVARTVELVPASAAHVPTLAA